MSRGGKQVGFGLQASGRRRCPAQGPADTGRSLRAEGGVTLAGGIDTALIDPGKPWQNGTDESFNGKFRDECLNVHWFTSIEDAQQKIDAFRWDYNEHHPHRALKGLSPGEFAKRMLTTAADSPS